ncbi:phosphatase PAP2 family protein [Aeromicrobium sp.]|uniref:phosphatase PAP2 family protein n=1 Tax=Aeromicrobium sp. TaxID=1871063 RepID=UPI0030BEFCDB
MTQSSQQSPPTLVARRSPALHSFRRAGIELTLIGALYAFYCVSRTLASSAFAPARGRALDILSFEKTWRFDVESGLNELFHQHEWLAMFGSYWYATTHYAVTSFVLVWIYRRSATEYVTARRALVFATIIGLGFYLLMPTAPPRLVDAGYYDILSMHSSIGWWSTSGSAPKGLGDITNELAAFPSLHAGWALWVAIVLIRAGVPRVVRAIGLSYAAMMTIVIIGTGNHWVLDAVVGWAVVLIAFGAVIAWEKGRPVVAHEDQPVPI